MQFRRSLKAVLGHVPENICVSYLVARQVGEEGDGLHRLPQAHLVGKDTVQLPLVQRHQPRQTRVLVLPEPQRLGEKERSRHPESARRGVRRLQPSQGIVRCVSDIDSGTDSDLDLHSIFYIRIELWIRM